MEVFQTVNVICFAWTSPSACPEIHFNYMNDDFMSAKVDEDGEPFGMEHPLEWPGYVYWYNGSFEIQFMKKEAKNWTRAVTRPHRKRTGEYATPYFFDVKVKNVVSFGPTSCAVTLEYIENIWNYFGPGRFMHIIPSYKDKDTRHSFFPLPVVPTDQEANDTMPKFDFFSYHRAEPTVTVLTEIGRPGSVPHKVCQLEKGETIMISRPKGLFCISMFDKQDDIIIIAEELGIVAVASIIFETVASRINKKVRLLHVNKSYMKVVFAEEWKLLSQQYPQFSYEYLIEEPSTTYSPTVGTFSKETLSGFLKSKTITKKQYVIVAGNRDFLFKAADMAVEFGCYKRNLYRLMT